MAKRLVNLTKLIRWLTNLIKGTMLPSLGILTIMSIFDHDSSKIVSKSGWNILSDEAKMKDVYMKIEEIKSKDPYGVVII